MCNENCPHCGKPITNPWHVLDCPERPKLTDEELAKAREHHIAAKIEYTERGKFRDSE